MNVGDPKQYVHQMLELAKEVANSPALSLRDFHISPSTVETTYDINFTDGENTVTISLTIPTARAR
jgi:hypothetical protein